MISIMSLLHFVPTIFLLLICSPIDLAPMTAASPSFRLENRTSSSNSTEADGLIWCHKSLGQYVPVQLTDCVLVLKILKSRDIKGVGTAAVFSWDASIATKSKDNVYLLPQTVKQGSCQARVQLNGVKSVQALWGFDIWDSFGQLMADCLLKRGVGGYTFAERTGTGLRVTMNGPNGDNDGSDSSNGASMGREYQAPTGNISTW